MEQDLTVNAIGRSAQLGSFYDAYNEKFITGMTISNKTKFPRETIMLTDISRAVFSYVITDSLKEKYEKLNIKGELKMSLMAGLLGIDGSGNYMSKEKSTFASIKSTFIYSLTTKREDISFSDKSLLKYIDPGILEIATKDNATHVVCGIEWGANFYATFEKDTDFKKNLNDYSLKGKLDLNIKSLFDGFKEMIGLGNNDKKLSKTSNDLNNNHKNMLEASIEGKNKETIDFKQFKFTFYADCVPSEEILPTKVEDVIPFMSKMPTFIKNDNEGKGIQMKFYLFSLKKLIEMMGRSIQRDIIIKKLEDETINKLEKTLDNFAEDKQKLNQFYKNVKDLSAFLAPEIVKQVSTKKDEIEKAESDFKSNFNFFLNIYIKFYFLF